MMLLRGQDQHLEAQAILFGCSLVGYLKVAETVQQACQLQRYGSGSVEPAQTVEIPVCRANLGGSVIQKLVKALPV